MWWDYGNASLHTHKKNRVTLLFRIWLCLKGIDQKSDGSYMIVSGISIGCRLCATWNMSFGFWQTRVFFAHHLFLWFASERQSLCLWMQQTWPERILPNLRTILSRFSPILKWIECIYASRPQQSLYVVSFSWIS